VKRLEGLSGLVLVSGSNTEIPYALLGVKLRVLLKLFYLIIIEKYVLID